MRPHSRATLLALVGAAAALLALAPAATADTRRVHRGQSIQAAIDRAAPGDTIRVSAGRFHENLTISKDHIRLIGAGMGARGTRLLPPAAGDADANNCSQPPDFVSGICISGDGPVTGTFVKGFWVRRFPGFGVFPLVANNTTVTHVQATHNAGYGISGFVLRNITYTFDKSRKNGEPGFYIGDSPHANAVVHHNLATANAETGFLFRDASMGVVRNNHSAHNCAGMIFVDTGQPGDAANWIARDNAVRVNNKDCRGGDLPFSGHGIVLGGTSHVTLMHNLVTGNQPAGPGTLLPGGGVIVVDTTGFGGDAPMHNVVRGNTILRNLPHDVFYDRSGSGNVFRNNTCASSIPASICS